MSFSWAQALKWHLIFGSVAGSVAFFFRRTTESHPDTGCKTISDPFPSRPATESQSIDSESAFVVNRLDSNLVSQHSKQTSVLLSGSIWSSFSSVSESRSLVELESRFVDVVGWMQASESFLTMHAACGSLQVPLRQLADRHLGWFAFLFLPSEIWYAAADLLDGLAEISLMLDSESSSCLNLESRSVSTSLEAAAALLLVSVLSWHNSLSNTESRSVDVVGWMQANESFLTMNAARGSLQLPLRQLAERHLGWFAFFILPSEIWYAAADLLDGLAEISLMLESSTSLNVESGSVSTSLEPAATLLIVSVLSWHNSFSDTERAVKHTETDFLSCKLLLGFHWIVDPKSGFCFAWSSTQVDSLSGAHLISASVCFSLLSAVEWAEGDEWNPHFSVVLS